MKEVNLDKNNFWYDNKVVSNLDMSSGKHIRFTAVDKVYNLTVKEPGGRTSPFPVSNDGTYHPFEIQGSKGDTFTFTIDGVSPSGTVPQMIVKVD